MIDVEDNAFNGPEPYDTGDGVPAPTVVKTSSGIVLEKRPDGLYADGEKVDPIPAPGRHACSQEGCHETFPTAKAREDHEHWIHGVPRPRPSRTQWGCSSCKARFESENELDLHQSRHRHRGKLRPEGSATPPPVSGEEKPMPMPMPTSPEVDETARPRDIPRAEAPARRSWPFPCDECDKGFDTAQGLALHRTRVHDKGKGVPGKKGDPVVRPARSTARSRGRQAVAAGPRNTAERPVETPPSGLDDPEVLAMGRCIQVLEPLGPDARIRALDWVCRRLGIEADE